MFSRAAEYGFCHPDSVLSTTHRSVYREILGCDEENMVSSCSQLLQVDAAVLMGLTEQTAILIQGSSDTDTAQSEVGTFLQCLEDDCGE